MTTEAMGDFSRAVVEIEGIAPYSQSHKHDEPKLEGEKPDDYDVRTWRSKMNVNAFDGKETMVIPAFALKMAIQSAAQYAKEKIPGQGNATWTGKFTSGIAILEDAPLGVMPDDVKPIALSMNSDGKRGGGSRVTRRLPQIPPGWRAKFEVVVLDPIITEDTFRKFLMQAGCFIGVGQYRPQNGGTNGRFVIKSLKWFDNRQAVRKAA